MVLIWGEGLAYRFTAAKGPKNLGTVTMELTGDMDLAHFEAAADDGEPEALYNLGLAYSTGKGVEPDYVVAHKWFNLAAMLGITEAQGYRTDLAEQMSQGELAKALKLAREWLTGR